MFLKIAAVLAILGISLSLLLSLMQQLFYATRILSYNTGSLMFLRILGILQTLLFDLPLIIFFIAFLLSLRGKSAAATEGA